MKGRELVSTDDRNCDCMPRTQVGLVKHPGQNCNRQRIQSGGIAASDTRKDAVGVSGCLKRYAQDSGFLLPLKSKWWRVGMNTLPIKHVEVTTSISSDAGSIPATSTIFLGSRTPLVNHRNVRDWGLLAPCPSPSIYLTKEGMVYENERN